MWSNLQKYRLVKPKLAVAVVLLNLLWVSCGVENVEKSGNLKVVMEES